jgi:hypothetical protein
MSTTTARPMTFEARIARRPELLELAPWGSVCVLELCVERSHEPPRRARARWRGPGTRRAIVLGEHARRIAPYLYPTRRVVIHGRLQSARWESPFSDERHACCLIAERVQLLGSPPPDMRRRAAPGSHPSVPAEHARVCTQRELSPTCRR